MIALVNESIPGVNTNPVTGGAIPAYAKVNGVETGKGTEVNDSEMRSRHVNILKIVSKNMASSQVGMWTAGGIPTTVSLESKDGTFNPYFVLETNVNGGPELSLIHI